MDRHKAGRGLCHPPQLLGHLYQRDAKQGHRFVPCTRLWAECSLLPLNSCTGPMLVHCIPEAQSGPLGTQLVGVN